MQEGFFFKTLQYLKYHVSIAALPGIPNERIQAFTE